MNTITLPYLGAKVNESMTENFIYFYSEIFNIVVVNFIKILLICFFLFVL
jgi:hypothetical protein